ncbi:MAG: GntR family transcriptional regulator [Clostridia bacterium]|nr:GntR family transcriptional regulator [Clostridia bacterium]
MRLLIDNKSILPIYDQIYTQIKEQILLGELQEHEQLPSIRGLAKDLKISFITTKRAYEELEKDGYIYTVQAKGCYVAPKNAELYREEQLKKIEEHLEEAWRIANACGIERAELAEMLMLLTQEEQ